VRLRPAGEQRRYLASQRAARIDPNPHQIDAVVFALERLSEGGCILADEVGLGKTIEAGLVIAQRQAEGAERVLLIAPKALLGQWRDELYTLFGITAVEVAPDTDLARAGVYLATRDFAGGERGAAVLTDAAPYDLAVVDEAHEVFAGLYRRFDREGVYASDAKAGVMAGRVRDVLRGTPVVLLTATPIQNSLTELWGLAQYVEPTGTLFGSLATFRDTFCKGDDRTLADGQDHELRRRIAEICRRTLRRQAQPFMRRPFVGRRARLLEYAMSPDERALYDDVTAYLLEPGIAAFRGNQRRLLLIGFHRLMASSTAALAASLDKVALRLERLLGGGALEDATADLLLDDLEDDVRTDPGVTDEGDPPDPGRVRAELARVRSLAQRARSLPSDAKAQALVRAISAALRGPADKVVVFTESITTQEYLRTVLCQSGLVTDEQVTLFRGTNDGPRAAQALALWRTEVGPRGRAAPSRDVAVRLALVHEFRTRGRVFIATEAGAKGLNLQFAGTLVNYDLPWNPQRIEQRIGRIHRYGQTQDVLVVNFCALDNEAQRLTLEILARKLDLFGTVLGATDEILHEPTTDAPEPLAGALAPDLEARLRTIYERARTQQEIAAELAHLRDTVVAERERFDQAHARTAGLIASRLDAEVSQALVRIQDELPAGLAELDRDLERVITAYLEAIGASWSREPAGAGARLSFAACAALPGAFGAGGALRVGDAPGEGEVLHPGHPLVRAAVDEARAATTGPLSLALSAPSGLAPGRRGRLRLVRVRDKGYDPSEQLELVAQLEGDVTPLDASLARALVDAPGHVCEPLTIDVDDLAMDDALAERLFVSEAASSARAAERFERAVDRIERFIEDRARVHERRLALALAGLREAEARRDLAVGAVARTQAEGQLARHEEDRAAHEAERDRLRRREDPEYARLVASAHERRARPLELEILFDARFVLVADGSQ